MPDAKPAARPVKTHALCYVGEGRYIAGVPTRDLDDTDLERVAPGHTPESLIASGLYRAAPAKAADTTSAVTRKES